MPNSKSKLDWCLASEKRMKNILPNDKLSKEHIEKAKHNLKAADYNIKGHFDDWAVSQSYYAMYHALLAILFNKVLLAELLEKSKAIVEKIEVVLSEAK